MAHRVLRMWNDSGREASRDFVALFILDPAFPPLKLGAELAMQWQKILRPGSQLISGQQIHPRRNSLQL